MLKRFFWTFSIIAILSIFAQYSRSMKQRMEVLDSISALEESSSEVVAPQRIAKKEKQELKPLKSVSTENQISNVTRKPSASDGIESFYKEAHQERRQQSLLENEFLKRYERVSSDYYDKTPQEKWTLIKEVYVTLEKESSSLLAFGPYKIVGVPKEDMPYGKLIYNEDQKRFAILTGRIIAQVHNLFDSDKISKDYDWLIENIHSDIKTVYYKPRKEVNLSEIRQLIDADSRINYFYFETVHNQWQKN